jgi:hypothetical protein
VKGAVGKHEEAMLSILQTMHVGEAKHRDRLEQMSRVGGDHEVLYHSAMLQGFGQAIHASRLVAVARDLGEQIEGSATKLATALDKVSTASDETATRLKNWTMALAIATFVLAGATIALVFVEYEHEAAAPTVVVIPPALVR